MLNKCHFLYYQKVQAAKTLIINECFGVSAWGKKCKNKRELLFFFFHHYIQHVSPPPAGVTPLSLLPLLERGHISSQVVPLYLQPGFPGGEAVHLPAQLPQLLLVDVPHAAGLLPPQLVQLRHQHLILLLQEAHLLYVAGKAVVQAHHLHLLVGARLLVLGLHQRVGGEVQPVPGAPQQQGRAGRAQGEPGHGAGVGEVARAAMPGGTAGGEAADSDPAACTGRTLGAETPPIGRLDSLTLHDGE